jgi:hypothetical protein
MPAVRFALTQSVEFDAEQAGQQFQARQRFAILAGANVGGDWLNPLRSRIASVIEFEAQGRRKTFALIARVGFAGHDQAVDPGRACQALESEDFLVDPLGTSGCGRAHHDQCL